MAPPTGPRGGSNNRKPTARASRGGVAKHRAATRTDRDGDVSMGAPISSSNPPTGPSGRGTRGRGAARGAPTRGSRTSSRLAQNLKNYIGEGGSKHAKTTLKILGVKNSKAASNSDGGVKGLLQFIERKADKDKKIVLGRGVLDGDYVWVKANKDDVSSIMHLNGYQYAGAPITIEETTEPFPTGTKFSKDAADTRQKLLALLAKRYNTEQKLLDLSALGTDDILGNLGAVGSQSLAEKSFRAIIHVAGEQFKTAEEKRQGIQSVSLARNEISDVDQVFTLAYSLPHLRRLDLSNNRLATFSSIAKWKQEFRYLEELYLVGNPVTGVADYAVQITQWFPCLQILDGNIVRSPQEAAEALRAMTPQPLAQLPSNLRDGENNVASIFLRSFFQLYDHDRPALAAQFYDVESVASLSATPEPGRDVEWKPYMKYSRNIQKLGGSRNPAVVQRLFTGASLIAEMWRSLPATRHATLDQPELWIIDCHTFPHLADPSGHGFAMGLMINVHGQFEEADTTEELYGTRTFSRSFILGPSKPGAPHPYRVLSDQLTIHKWTPRAAGAAPVPVTTGAPAAPIAPVAPVVAAVPVIDDATRVQLIQELARRTGMNAQYSELCLSGTANWNFDLALQSFEEQRANLPPAAFTAPA
ncbi:nuclear mRNA export, poly(A)+RNA binding protein [Podospora pseudopauciseta]|uniref:Nuclear mRNA export, poly(A)+RNA binding protein n=1 Tax=Podospora pseudopauciseta TaxID=2093780 RepID=A0ABR0HZV8_9PEZI|nr:nuclear mRNA export, poly(A)+RNA binding protein [Podospora pseudopauciseta]